MFCHNRFEKKKRKLGEGKSSLSRGKGRQDVLGLKGKNTLEAKKGSSSREKRLSPAEMEYPRRSDLDKGT